MDGDEEIKRPTKVFIGMLFLLIVAVALTIFVTKNMTEKNIQETYLHNLNNAYSECQQTCGLKQPAFTSLDGESLTCICLDNSNGNSANNEIQS